MYRSAVQPTKKHLTEATRMGVFVFLAASTAACSSSPATAGSDDGQEGLDPDSVEISRDEASLHLVAQVGLPGRVIKFFEPEPGVLLTLEKGLSERDEPASPEEASLRGSALYTFLAKAPAPQALLDAEARATPPPSDDGTGTVESDPEPPAPSDGLSTLKPLGGWERFETSSRSTFLADYCTKTDRFYERIGVNFNTWQTTSGTNYMKAGARADSGTVLYTANYGNRYILSGAVLNEGWYLGWRWSTTIGQSTQSRAYPINGGGTYDHCVNWHY